MRLDYWVQYHTTARRVLVAAIAAILALTLLPASPAGAADGFVLEGGGWGHSVGMSQYGALGMSQEGSDYEDILTHYFTGTSIADVDPALAAKPVWVNLTMENPSLTFTVRSIGPSPVPATFTVGSTTVVVQVGQSITITRQSNGGCTVSGPSGTVNGDCSIRAEWDGWTDSPSTAVVIGGCYLTNWNAPGGSVSQPCTYARGTLHVKPDNNTNTINTALEIDVEDYVLGISEMPYGWASIGGAAALQAQAIAARSYVFARARWRGEPETRPWCWCQVYDTHYDQNYVGWGHGTQAWVDAVASTAGVVLTHPSVTSNGQLVPIETFYSSSTFGRTENSEDSFTATVPYLRSVDDHWSRLPAVGNPHASWSKSFTGSGLASLLPGLSTVTNAQITRCSATGAALEVTFSGSGGPITFHTRTLRGTLGIRSQQITRIVGPGSTSSCEGSTAITTTTTSTTAATTTTTTTTIPATTTTTVPATTTTTTIPATTTTTTVPATGGAASCPTAEVDISSLLASQRTLRLGTRGQDVADVQRILTALAIYGGAIDGVYGQRTTSAVRSFQDARGLSVDGIVGSRTRGELASMLGAAEHRRVLASDGRLLKRGVSGDVVKALQAVLQTLGYDPGPVDGIYGSRTRQAVELFQRQKSLLVDGIVGIQSRAALTEALDLYALAECS